MIIPFPFKGKNSTTPASEQAPETSSDMLNMRPFHAATGKRRGSQRSGMTLYCRGAPIAVGPVRALAQITFDSRKFTYAASAGSLEWSA